MRISRDEWAKRVERWKDSGLTAKEFAVELGVNPRTLVFWKWQLGKVSASKAAKQQAGSASSSLPLIELAAPTAAMRFELELGVGRRLTIPSTFDADVLRRLLEVLEPTS
jgi:hypothetical protein